MTTTRGSWSVIRVALSVLVVGVALVAVLFMVALALRDPCPSLDLAKGVGCTVHDGSWGPL